MKKRNQYRYERKYLIPFNQQSKISSIINSNSLRFYKQFKKRSINSIYFDTDNLDYYAANLNGDLNRKKIRMRWYGLWYGLLNSNLEIKNKCGLVGNKYVYKLPELFVDKSTNILSFNSLFTKSNLPNNIGSLFHILKPRLFISYTREYYKSRIIDCRLTLDTNIKYISFSSNKFIIEKTYSNTSDMIVELKTGIHDEEKVLTHGYQLPFRISKHSKYATGIQRFYNL